MTCHVINFCQQMAPSFAPAAGAETSGLQRWSQICPVRSGGPVREQAGFISRDELLCRLWSPQNGVLQPVRRGRKTGHKVLKHARCKVDRGTEKVSPRAHLCRVPSCSCSFRSATAGTVSLTRRTSQSHCLMHVCATTGGETEAVTFVWLICVRACVS